jgi:adenylyltransferase/sulfurtransferase
MVDVWKGDFERVSTEKGTASCPVCDEGRYDLLQAKLGSEAVVLCGREAVQVTPRPALELDLASLADRLADAGLVSANEHLLRLEAEGVQLTVFADGRTIVKGTSDPARARALFARYVGM